MLGDTYTIVDMNVWGWARLIPTVLGEGAWEKFLNLKRLVDEISARPAAQKAVALKDRHKFKTEMDEEELQAMFPHLNVKAASKPVNLLLLKQRAPSLPLLRRAPSAG